MFGIPTKLIIYFTIAAITFTSIVATFMTIKHYIAENAKKDIIIETQQNSIETLKANLELLKELDELKENIIKIRDEEIQALEDDLEHAAENLGEGVDDAAPEPLKNLFRNLQ